MKPTRFLHLPSIALLATQWIMCPAGAAADEGGRGIWWWTSPGHPMGVDEVLGNPAKEVEALRFLKQWNFDRVYCCYGSKSRKAPSLIRAWNSKLHEAGISTQCLLSENTWIYPEHRPKLLEQHIMKELVEFNAGSTASEKHDALHLDIEPHGIKDWKLMNPAERKSLLILLQDTFAEVRAFMDRHGAAEIPVYADLPVWYDQVPGPVGWDSEAERDAWFASLAKSLKGISLMAYERKTKENIEKGVMWELKNFKGEARVALEAVSGKGRTWASVDELIAMLNTQESLKEPPRSVDVHDFIQVHDLTRKNPPRD